jgi:hypothetical protein
MGQIPEKVERDESKEQVWKLDVLGERTETRGSSISGSFRGKMSQEIQKVFIK